MAVTTRMRSSVEYVLGIKGHLLIAMRTSNQTFTRKGILNDSKWVEHALVRLNRT